MHLLHRLGPGPGVDTGSSPGPAGAPGPGSGTLSLAVALALALGLALVLFWASQDPHALPAGHPLGAPWQVEVVEDLQDRL